MQADWSIKTSILLVDDVPANLRTLTDLLSAHYRLRFATSGLQALQLLKADPLPDLILLDVMMPDMDGYAVCREIKRWVTTQHIPVIFLTALDEDNDEVLGLEVGADDFITKPFKPEIVLARIRNLLRRHAHAKPLEPRVRCPQDQLIDQKGTDLAYFFSRQPHVLSSGPTRFGLPSISVDASGRGIHRRGNRLFTCSQRARAHTQSRIRKTRHSTNKTSGCLRRKCMHDAGIEQSEQNQQHDRCLTGTALCKAASGPRV